MSDVTYSLRAEKILRDLGPEDSPLAQAAINGELAKARAIREVDASVKYIGRLVADAVRESKGFGQRKPGFFRLESLHGEVAIVSSDWVRCFNADTDETTRAILNDGTELVFKGALEDVFDLAVGV